MNPQQAASSLTRNATRPWRAQIVGGIAVLVPLAVEAQARGGGCRGGLCAVTGTVIGLALLGVFLLSVARSITRHGFVRGLIRHEGVRILILYAAIVGGIVFLAIAVEKVLGKLGAMIAFSLLAVGLAWSSSRGERKPNSNGRRDPS